MKKRPILISLFVLYIFAVIASIIILSTGKTQKEKNSTLANLASLANGGQNSSKATIGVVSMNGPISFVQDKSGLFLNNSQGATYWLEQLDYAATNDSIKAVLIQVNSPGGTVGASQELSGAVKRIQEAGKPVITSVADMSASGGYYATVSSDKIFANAGSLVGSIGVILGGVEYAGLMKKLGITYQAITSGKNKDILSPYKALTPEQREFLQNMVYNTYDQFLTAVAEGRDKPKNVVRPYADGSVFTGEQAKGIGLIDEVGTYYDALQYVRTNYNLQDAEVTAITPNNSKNFSLKDLLSVVAPRPIEVSVDALESKFGNTPILYLYEF